MRKGQAFSTNIIVGMILGLVMLGAGLAIFFNIYNSSKESLKDVDTKIEAEILKTMSANDLLYVPYTTKDTRGDPVDFYFGINNINREQKTFKLRVDSGTESDQSGLKKNNILFSYDENQEFEISGAGKKVMKILVINTKDLSAGQHAIVISVFVKKSDGTYEFYAKQSVIVNKR